MKQGAASAQVAQQEEAEHALRKEQQGKMFRFFLDDKEEAQITFVDGALNEQGFLVPPRFYEHGLKVNGKFQTFVCPQKSDPDAGHQCPICEQGDRPYLLSVFTIIDHRIRKARDSDKTYQHTRRIFAAKPQTFEILNKLALKYGGLAGKTFDVSRVGDKAPAVGSMFMPIGQTDIAILQQQFMEDVLGQDGKPTGQKKTYFVPANYEQEIVFQTEVELRQMGFGKSMGGMGGGGYSGFQAGQGMGGNGGGFNGGGGFNPSQTSQASHAAAGGFKPGGLPGGMSPVGGAAETPQQPVNQGMQPLGEAPAQSKPSNLSFSGGKPVGEASLPATNFGGGAGAPGGMVDWSQQL
jgi:hypothetical protein